MPHTLAKVVFSHQEKTVEEGDRAGKERSATWKVLHLMSKQGIQMTVLTEVYLNGTGYLERHLGSGNRFLSHSVIFKAMGFSRFLLISPNSLSMIAF